MKDQTIQKTSIAADKARTPQAPKAQEQKGASGRWSAVQRVRLPHKVGLPLSSGGCGDQIER